MQLCLSGIHCISISAHFFTRLPIVFPAQALFMVCQRYVQFHVSALSCPPSVSPLSARNFPFLFSPYLLALSSGFSWLFCVVLQIKPQFYIGFCSVFFTSKAMGVKTCTQVRKLQFQVSLLSKYSIF